MFSFELLKRIIRARGWGGDIKQTANSFYTEILATIPLFNFNFFQSFLDENLSEN